MMENTLAEKIRYEKDMYISSSTPKDINRTYEHDRMYLQRIRNGDIQAVLNNRDAQTNENPVTQPIKDSLKNFEYKVCAAITLATYAAIEGGLDPASAYALSDLYLKRLELCKDITEMKQLHKEMELIFAQHVNTILQERSSFSYVEKCKLFINQHLHMPFTLDDISAAISVNKSYLSRLFTQEVGMRVMEYARIKRIEAAAETLKYSDKTIAAIAANFCFSTQSHFGDLFKKVMGMTPLKYRAANQIIEVRSIE